MDTVPGAKTMSIDKLFLENRMLASRMRRLERTLAVKPDYPFKTWQEYGRAFAESCNARSCADYPNYQNYTAMITNAEYMIIKEMLEDRFDAQEGIDTFIKVIIEGARSSYELFEFKRTGYDILRLFKKHDVRLNVAEIFNYKRSDSFEDTVADFAVRGILLDACVEAWGDDWSYYLVEPYGDWKNVESKYWEDIIDEKIDEVDHEKALQMSMKYSSKYLGDTGI